MKRVQTLTSNPGSNLNKISIKDYHTSLAHQEPSFPKYKNLDLSY